MTNVYTHLVLTEQNMGNICLSHIKQLLAAELAILEDFRLIGDGICSACDAEAKWHAIPVQERTMSQDDGKGTIIVGDQRDPKGFRMVINYPFEDPNKPRKPRVVSRMRELEWAFERAFPTAKERSKSTINSSTEEQPKVNSLDLEPHRKPR
jgi:hypothetical protein